jgi:hypothetical protein
MTMYHLLRVRVTDTDRQVIREVRRKMRQPCRNDPGLRVARKEAYKWILKDHHKAQELYKQWRLG